ncbi:MAG: ATP-binding protein [Oligosphaeraceae bacterium]|nr:ATP-binding protein [Oligosphaeraceae bacterium]
MQKLTSSVYTFEKLIRNDFLYVDKTEYIWKLISEGPASFFMSRPRRFGKSLTVSTLKAVFQGKKELFKGLAIYDKEYDWKEYPVIHLDMANCDARTPVALRKYLARVLVEAASSHRVSVDIHEDELAASFESLVRAVANTKDSPVVILLDEYDKPILNALATPEAAACRDVLKGFYSTIKKCESLERFVFVTGVTKFSHVSLFSDLNNLADITMHADYATMLGYTQEEFEKHFAERLDDAVRRLGIPREQLLDEIKTWYDGYRFHAKSATVYNPVSLAQFFINGCEFSNYWFSTGAPSFLLEVIRKTDFNFERALNEPVMGFAFSAFEIDRIDPLTLLLQTGYLTIKSSFVELGETQYYLDFPNREVKAAFKTYLISDYSAMPQETIGANVFQMVKAIKAKDIHLFMNLLKSFFAAVQYDVTTDSEGRFQLLFYSVFLLMGVRIEAESRTNDGRIDAVIRDGDCIYIFEFKMNQTAEVALAQIRDKEYYQKYQHAGKRLLLIGASFDTASRQIADWKIEEA